MTTLIYILPIILVLVVVMLVIKGKNLSEVELEADEKILFTDENPKLEMKLIKPHYEQRPRAIIKVTNKRILCYQKPLLSKKLNIAYTIDYSGGLKETPYSDFVGGAVFKKGYLEFATDKSMISFEKDKQDNDMVKILLKMKEVPLQIKDPIIMVTTKNVDQYKKHLQ